MITDPDGPFQDCLIAKVDLTHIQEDCIYDACTNDPTIREQEIIEVRNNIYVRLII